MEQRLIARIRELETSSPERARFAERLLAAIATIDRQYQGEERKRMLETVEKTLDRFVELGQQTSRIQNALRQMRSDFAELRQLVEFLTAPAADRTLH